MWFKANIFKSSSPKITNHWKVYLAVNYAISFQRTIRGKYSELSFDIYALVEWFIHLLIEAEFLFTLFSLVSNSGSSGNCKWLFSCFGFTWSHMADPDILRGYSNSVLCNVMSPSSLNTQATKTTTLHKISMVIFKKRLEKVSI